MISSFKIVVVVVSFILIVEGDVVRDESVVWR
jgi:hypothetical protein